MVDLLGFILRTHLSDWISYYEGIGLSANVYGLYLPYIKVLLAKKLPVILDFSHLAALLGRRPSYLASVINSSKSHYRVFSIPKKRGGVRKIEAPYPALLEIQRWIYKNILSSAKIHRAAHGFRPKKSIITNAKTHIGSNEILNVDIQNFFPSIPINRAIKVFLDFGYPPQVAYSLAAICCLEKRLPQGAPTSPALSNLVMKGLDTRLHRLAASQKLNYTRYADDITFSGKKIPIWLTSIIEKIVTDSGFLLNSAKTRLADEHANRRIVTGIDVKSNRLSVPKPYRRALSHELYHVKTWGLQSHLARRKIRDPEYLHRLIGRLNYWKQVEPENNFVSTQLRTLKDLFNKTKN